MAATLRLPNATSTLLSSGRESLPARRQPAGLPAFRKSGVFGDRRIQLSTPACNAHLTRYRRPKTSTTITSLFGLGVPELVVIAGVAVVLFGPKQLPEIGKSLGKTVKSFQQAAKEFQTEIKTSADGAADASPASMTVDAVKKTEEKEKV